MEKPNKRIPVQYYGTIILLLITPALTLIAQSDVKIDSREVSSWFERNWMWIAGGFLVLLIIAFSGRSGKKKKTTTIVKDDAGNVKSITTTEIKE